MKILRYVLCVVFVLMLCVSANAFTVASDDNSLEITSYPDKRTKAGEEFSFTFTSNADPSEAVEWLIEETLPAGLELDADEGVLSGTPTIEGEYTLHVTVRVISTTETAYQEFTLTITSENYGAGEESSGGCDSGFGLLGLAAVFMLCKKNSCHFLSA